MNPEQTLRNQTALRKLVVVLVTESEFMDSAYAPFTRDDIVAFLFRYP
jgi:hypothetical protein